MAFKVICLFAATAVLSSSAYPPQEFGYYENGANLKRPYGPYNEDLEWTNHQNNPQLPDHRFEYLMGPPQEQRDPDNHSREKVNSHLPPPGKEFGNLMGSPSDASVGFHGSGNPWRYPDNNNYKELQYGYPPLRPGLQLPGYGFEYLMGGVNPSDPYNPSYERNKPIFFDDFTLRNRHEFGKVPRYPEIPKPGLEYLMVVPFYQDGPENRPGPREFKDDSAFSNDQGEGGMPHNPQLPGNGFEYLMGIGELSGNPRRSLADNNNYKESQFGNPPLRPGSQLPGNGFEYLMGGVSSSGLYDPSYLRNKPIFVDDSTFSNKYEARGAPRYPDIPKADFEYMLGVPFNQDGSEIQPNPNEIKDDSAFSNGQGKGGIPHNPQLPGNGFEYLMGVGQPSGDKQQFNSRGSSVIEKDGAERGDANGSNELDSSEENDFGQDGHGDHGGSNNEHSIHESGHGNHKFGHGNHKFGHGSHKLGHDSHGYDHGSHEYGHGRHEFRHGSNEFDHDSHEFGNGGPSFDHNNLDYGHGGPGFGHTGHHGHNHGGPGAEHGVQGFGHGGHRFGHGGCHGGPHIDHRKPGFKHDSSEEESHEEENTTPPIDTRVKSEETTDANTKDVEVFDP